MIQAVANGLAVGGIYGLLAVSFSVIYGVLRLVNFAFGEVFMVGAFAAAVTHQSTTSVAGHTVHGGLPMWASILVGLLVGGLVGFLVERLAYRPLRQAPVLTLMITAISVSLLLRAIATYVFGAAQVPVDSPDLGAAWTIFGARVQRLDVVILAVAVAATLLFWVMLTKTPLGRAIRGTAMDPDAARLMGIGVDRVVAGTFLLGSLMAALAGILYSQRYGFAAATMGFVPGLKALVAAVLGGVGSVTGAFAGGLVLGLVEELSATYVPQGQAYRDVIAFAVLIAVLWVRPRGLFGARTLEKV